MGSYENCYFSYLHPESIVRLNYTVSTIKFKTGLWINNVQPATASLDHLWVSYLQPFQIQQFYNHAARSVLRIVCPETIRNKNSKVVMLGKSQRLHSKCSFTNRWCCGLKQVHIYTHVKWGYSIYLPRVLETFCKWRELGRCQQSAFKGARVNCTLLLLTWLGKNFLVNQFSIHPLHSDIWCTNLWK